MSVTETAMVAEPTPPRPRKVKDVPYVEFFNNRLQGVVKSGSDEDRVYCAFIEAETGAYYSSTNNNRPDAGMAKRLQMLVKEAEAQFGREKLAVLMQFGGGATFKYGRQKPEPASEVFSRFLTYLRFVELEVSEEPVPEMAWFLG